MRLFALLFLISSIPVSAQTNIYDGKAPLWATHYEYSTAHSDTIETSNGYAYLLISRQNHLELNEQYSEYVMKVTSEKGLSIVSSINEYFDPSYQKLTFHKLNIIRDGKTINKLNPVKFDVIRREEDMHRAVYDKSVNAIYNLPDVRVGDIVEYSLTRKGRNPAFKDHAFGEFYLQYGTPVAKFAYKVIYKPQRKFHFKTFGDAGVVAKETVEQQLKSIEWVRENVPALLTDDGYPGWFNPYPRVQYSDFQSWNDVKRWAASLYNFPVLKSSELKDAIEAIKTSAKTDEEKIKACIRIAQEDIRYLSFSDGIHGYKPHSPQDVYSQKYGDCKDKSFMLALMLNQLGIDSRPALVSTDKGYILPDVLPNPWAFNHCIVQFTYNDSTYWIDPTLNPQVGSLNSYYFPLYHHALVLTNDQLSLTPIPFGYKNSSLAVMEEYSMNEVGGNVTLNVTTTYHGDEADEIRDYYKSHTTEQITKDYLNFYAQDFSEISSTKDFTYIDNVESNVITSSEEYLIKDFWTISGNKKTATVYASLLASYLKKPETRIRTMPLAVSYPRNISQTIKILLPEEWDIKDANSEIESDAFLYRGSKFYYNKTITLRYYYTTKAAFIPAEKVADHIKKIDQVLDENGFTIYKPLGKQDKQYDWSYVVIFLVVIAGVYLIRKKFHR